MPHGSEMKRNLLPEAFLLTGITLVYSVLFVALFPILDTAVTIFQLFPPLIIAWIRPLRYSLIYTLFIAVWTNFVLFSMVGFGSSQVENITVFLINSLVAFILVVMIGRLRDLQKELNANLLEKENNEAELRQLNHDLEARGQHQLKALETNERSYHQLLQQASGGVFICNHHGQFTNANDQACQMTGYTFAELLRMEVRDLVLPDDLEKNGLRLDDLLTGKTLLVERQLRRKDGSRFYAEISASLLPDGSLQGIVRDITSRKRNEQAILNIAQGIAVGSGKQFFRSLVGQIAHTMQADMVFVAELDPSAEECVHTIAVFENGKIAPNFTYSLENTPCRNVVGKQTCVYPRKVAELFPQDNGLVVKGIEGYIGSPLFTSAGEALGIMVVLFRQPIDNPSLDDSIFQIFATRAAAELERMRSENALRESEERWRQSQKMEAIGQLAGGIAHDFNNILTVIISYSDLLLHSHPDPRDRVHRQVKQIKEAGDRAAAVTHQLLAFSRRQVLEPKLINLNTAVTHMIAMLTHLIGEEFILTTRLADDLWLTKADAGQFEQVIMNLVINARDAMPTGGEVTIETMNVSVEENEIHGLPEQVVGKFIRLTVSDTGIGMSEQTQARIFEPFFTTKELSRGTGLGLAMVHGIVTQSGGYILVDSCVGRGTCFQIFLPKANEDIEVSLKENETVPAVAHQETILLVEDEASVRFLAFEILTQYGYHVLTALGEEALDVCEAYDGRIHLLLTDVVMPGISGPELAAVIMKQRSDLRVLFMTGYTDDVMLLHGVETDEIALLQKPFTPSSLVQKVRQVLDAALV